MEKERKKEREEKRRWVKKTAWKIDKKMRDLD